MLSNSQYFSSREFYSLFLLILFNLHPLFTFSSGSPHLQLSTIGRCEYEKTCALLVQLFDESAQSYQQLTSSPQSNTNDMQIAIQEGRLTWLVNIIGAVIGGRQSYISTDDHDAMDGELVCR